MLRFRRGISYFLFALWSLVQLGDVVHHITEHHDEACETSEHHYCEKHSEVESCDLCVLVHGAIQHEAGTSSKPHVFLSSYEGLEVREKATSQDVQAYQGRGPPATIL